MVLICRPNIGIKFVVQAKQSTFLCPSPYCIFRGGLFRGNSDEGISQDGEELTMAELKVQLEVSEGETGLLRKKVEGLLTGLATNVV